MASESKPGRGAATGKGASARPGRSGRRRGGVSELFSLDSERSARILLLGSVGLIVAIAAGFIAFGYWYAEVRPQNRTVLEADGVKVSFRAMKRRMAYELASAPQFQQAIQLLPEATYSRVLDEITVVTRAGDLGISITQEDIDAQLRQEVGVTPDSDQRVFADRFRAKLDETGLTEAEYRRMVEAEVLSDRIRNKFTSEAPPTVEQAKVEAISTNTVADAQKARERVAAGEDWATVARELSTDLSAPTDGGLEPFAPNGDLNQAYNDWAFENEPGTISDPLSAQPDQPPFYIVRVVERSDQPLTDDQKPGYVSRQYNQWLEDTQAKMTIVRHWEVADQSEALRAVIKSVPAPTQVIRPTLVPVSTPVAGATTGAVATVPAGSGSAPGPSGAPQPDGQ